MLSHGICHFITSHNIVQKALDVVQSISEAFQSDFRPVIHTEILALQVIPEVTTT
jgi:hypothetical protein